MMRLLWLLLVLLASCATTQVEAPEPRDPHPDLRLYIYHPFWVGDTWLRYDWAFIDGIYFFDLQVDGTGRFSEANGYPLVWLDMLRMAALQGRPVMPVVSQFRHADFVQLFGSSLYRSLLVQHLLEAVRLVKAPGLQLDFEIFEPVPEAVRAGFVAFVRDLRQTLDALPWPVELSLYTLAFDPADVFDEAALIPYVDYFMVQGYDLHWRSGERAGPVAPVRGWDTGNWEAILQRLLQLGIPREKIIMGIPFFGYEWPVASSEVGARTRGPARTLVYTQVDTLRMPGYLGPLARRLQEVEVRRDPLTGTPYYVYQDTTGWYQGWFEDPQTIREKVAFVRRHHLAGMAVFAPAYDDGTLWDALKREVMASPRTD